MLGCSVMDISYLGHSSFKIKGRTVTLITDPFDSENVGIKFPKTEADIVTISHEHKDHNSLEKVDGVKNVIRGVGEYEIAGVSIVGISSFHDDKEGTLRGKNIIYAIEMDDLRVVHMGDLGHELSDKIADSMGDIDILMIPVGGFYTIGPKEAAEIVKKLEPSFTIPMHFQDTGLNSAIYKDLAKVDDFLEDVGYEVEKTTKLSIKKELINEDISKVVILERK